jgi:hypothetical protein
MFQSGAAWYDAARPYGSEGKKDVSKGRLEAFSDGVIAIIITIMVLDLHVPHDTSLAALRPAIPTFLSYALSFVFVGIYWNNHHHLLHAHAKSERNKSLGEPAPPVLAFTRAVCHRLDG